MPELLNWVQSEEELTEGAMTVRAQTVPEDDDGQLAWPVFFPRVDVESTEINELDEIDDRPVADRREWDARGRLIALVTPDTRKLEFIPIESRDAIREREINKLSNEVRGNQDIFRSVIGARIPARVERLARANYRRVEVDAFTAWAMGYVDQVDPETGRTFRTSFQFDAGRYQVAGTSWLDAGVNAYNELVAWVEDGADAIGAVGGVMLRRAIYNKILKDAPELAGGVKMTKAQLEARLTDDLGFEFRFFRNEQSLDIHNDGGITKTRTKVWPSDRIALVPAGLRVGNTAFAPVVRAQDLVNELGEDAGIDVRGNTVYYDKQNGGRGLDFEVQLNSFSVPAASKMWVKDVA